MNTFIIYHYYEKNDLYRDNLVYFLSVGISKSAKYYIIIAGDCSVNLPEFDNVTYLRTENKNYDFGGYCFFLKWFDFKTVNSNDIFIFMNSSVRGPFIANYYNKDWYKIFSTKLVGNTKLVGGSINILPSGIDRAKLVEKSFKAKAPFPHVQTTVYAMPYEALSYLMSVGLYDIDYEIDRAQVILLYELRISHEILKNGWKISTYLPIYSKIDYQTAFSDDNHSSKSGDAMFANGFFGRTLSPQEAVFVKTNRNMISNLDLYSHTYTELKPKVGEIEKFSDAKVLLNKSFKIIRAPQSTFKKLIKKCLKYLE